MLKSTGNFGPPKYSLSDTVALPKEITAEINNKTVIKMPAYEDPDFGDKIYVILDFDRAILFTNYDMKT